MRSLPPFHPNLSGLSLALRSLLVLLILCVPFAPNSIDTNTLIQLLRPIGLTQYRDVFQQKQLDGTALASLTSEELLELGIKPLGHRKKILLQIRKYLDDASSSNSLLTAAAAAAAASTTGPGMCSASAITGENECMGATTPLSPTSGVNPYAHLSPTRTHLPHGLEDDSTDKDNAGWRYEAYGHHYDTDRCNIETRTAEEMTPELFAREYFLKKPVIILPSADRAEAIRRTRAHWSKTHMRKEHGDFEVGLGTPQQLTAYGEGKLRMSLSTYLNELSADPASLNASSISITHYMFDRNQFLEQNRELLTSYRPPSLFRESSSMIYSSKLTFALGPTSSGINFHYHKDGWNEVIHGRKRWFLYPPSVGVPPYGYNQFEAAKIWYELNYHRLTEKELPYECVQYPGETFYVPEDWYHATINIGETIAIIGQTKEPSPGTLMELVARGLQNADEGGPKAVTLKYYESALEKFPGFAQVYNLIGNHHRSVQQWERAQQAYTMAVKFNPLYSMAWSSLGQIQLQTQQFVPALASFTRANDLGKGFYDTLLGLGSAYYMNGDLERAVPYLEESIPASEAMQGSKGIDASHPQASYVNLCIIYTNLGRPEKAEALAKKWLGMFPKDARMMMAYGMTLRALRQYDEALAQYQKVLKLEPKNEIAKEEMANAKVEKKDWEEQLRSDSAHSESESPGGHALRVDKDYFKATKQGKYRSNNNLKESTKSALRAWRKELISKYLESFFQGNAAVKTDSEQDADHLSVYQIYATQSHYNMLDRRAGKGMQCINSASAGVNTLSADGCQSVEKLIPAFAENDFSKFLLQEHSAILSVGAVLPTLSQPQTSSSQWIGFTSADEAHLVGKEKGFRQLVSSSPTFIHEVLSLPYASIKGPVESALLGLDVGAVQARLPEHHLTSFLDTLQPSASGFILETLQAMGMIDAKTKSLANIVPRGLMFYSNRFACSHESFQSYWRFLVVFLDTALSDSIMPSPFLDEKSGDSLKLILERLPNLWALLLDRPMMYAQSMDYIHETDRKAFKQLAKANEKKLQELFEKFVQKHGEKQLVEKWQTLSQESNLTPPAAAEVKAVKPNVKPTESIKSTDPFLASLSLPLVFPSFPQFLWLEHSYNLQAGHPSTIRKLSHPEVFEVVSTPPVLNTPVMPTFTGGSAQMRDERQFRCEKYEETRVTSLAFQVQTANNWWKATEGNLHSAMSVFEILGETDNVAQTRSPIYIGWDGLVATSNNIFSFEKACISGLYCLLDELRQLELIQIAADSPDNPALKGVITNGVPLNLHVKLPTPFALTGLAIVDAFSRASEKKRKFPLGIQTDHQARVHATFTAQLKHTPAPPAPLSPGRIVSESEHNFPELEISSKTKGAYPSCEVQIHMYPRLIVVEQYMSTVNYAHWLNEVGPKILAIKPLLLRDPLVRLLVQPNGWTLNYLDTAGIPRDRIVFAHPCILHTAERVYLAPPNPLDSPSLQLLSFTRFHLMQNPAPPQPADAFVPAGAVVPVFANEEAVRQKREILDSDAPYIISMFRPPPVARSVTNSQAVEEVIRKTFPNHRIARFDAADYSFNETVTLFSRASAVIGVVGAGFANLAFTQPPTLAIQIVPAKTHIRLPCGLTPWWHIAELVRVDIRSMVVEDAEFLGKPFEMPIKDFQSFLNSIKKFVK